MKSVIIRFMALIGFLCIASWTNPVFSEEEPQQTLSFAGQWPIHPGKAIAMDPQRQLLYLGDGETINILDSNLHFISSFKAAESSQISGLFFSSTDNLLYIACRTDGLKIYDLTDTVNPLPVSSYLPDSLETVGVFIDGSKAYLSSGIDGMIILDITDIKNPSILSQSWLPGGFGISYALDIYASGNFAFVADLYNGLHIVDVSNPLKPDYKKGISLAGAADIAVSGDYLYITLQSGIAILDISTPEDTFVSSLFAAEGVATSVRVDGAFAFISYNSTGVRALDITSKTDPFHDPTWIYDGSGGSSLGLFPDDNVLFFANDQFGLQKIDITDKPNMQPIASHDTPADASAIEISGNYIYTLDNNVGHSPKKEGLRIIELTSFRDTVQLQLKGFCPTPGKASDVMVSNAYAFVADGEMGLQIIDIADKTEPVIIGACDTPGLASGVFVSGNYAFVADGDMGLAVVDITDKTSPSLVGSVDTQGIAAKITVDLNYAFIADGGAGLQIVNVADKTAPVIIGVCDTPGLASGVFVSENYAFVADGDMGMAVVDITDKSTPVRVTSVDTPGFAGNISMIGDNAFVADGKEGVSVINVAIPAQPVRDDDLSYDSTGFAADISRGYTSEEEALFIFIADGPAGLIALNVAWVNTNDAVNSGGGSAGCFIQAAGIR